MRLLSGLIATTALATLVLAGLPALAQEGRFRPIGEITYEPPPPRAQSDVFRIEADDRLISAMRIEAVRGDAEILELRLVYRDGARQSVRVRERLREGSQTTTIRLQEPRRLRAVEVDYVPEGRVRLSLLAERRAIEPPAPPRWVEIACQTAGFLLDRDVIEVRSQEPFRALRLRASGFDMEVSELNVRYRDGTRDRLPARAIVPAGAVTQPIELRGRDQRITQLELLHRSRVLSNQKAQMCIEGLVSREAP